MSALRRRTEFPLSSGLSSDEPQNHDCSTMPRKVDGVNRIKKCLCLYFLHSAEVESLSQGRRRDFIIWRLRRKGTARIRARYVLPRISNIARARPDAVIVSRQADVPQLELAECIDGRRGVGSSLGRSPDVEDDRSQCAKHC
ncbi:UNVERIFIED_ORG: hypothetical protein J2W85_003093 [Ensifer adhaerens]|nr:hypothetical protein [Ensifer adhaerens]